MRVVSGTIAFDAVKGFGMLIFKVLDANGKPLHGGKGDWSLPTPPTEPGGEWTPGDWMPEIAEPKCCERGYHGTVQPMTWWRKDARLFVMESRGAMSFESDKACVAAARLVEEVTAEWKWLPLYPLARCFLAANGKLGLSRANLSGANLYGADLSRANLSATSNFDGAKICLCNTAACDNVRKLLAGFGWSAGADGLLTKTKTVAV